MVDDGGCCESSLEAEFCDQRRKRCEKGDEKREVAREEKGRGRTTVDEFRDFGREDLLSRSKGGIQLEGRKEQIRKFRASCNREDHFEPSLEESLETREQCGKDATNSPNDWP